MADTPSCPPPSSILIIGAGVFGLSTACALLKRTTYVNSKITIVDSLTPSPTSTQDTSAAQLGLTASLDSSRVIRSDYVTPLYRALSNAALSQWRCSPIFSPHYHQSGIAVTYNPANPPDDGEGYARASLVHNRNFEGEFPSHIELLSSKSDVQRVMAPTNGSGSEGFINRASGWADASGAMRSLRAHVNDLGVAHGNFHWISDHVSGLAFSSPPQTPSVIGAKLASGKSLSADVTILAAGAWSGKLLDLRGRMQATAQLIAYVQLRPQEAEALAKIPVLLNLSTGFFLLPPTPEGILKIARHTQGWRTETRIPHPELPSRGSAEIETVATTSTEMDTEIKVSLPASDFVTLPPSSIGPLCEFLEQTIPGIASRLGDKPFCATRVCWYSDTPTGDFIIDWVPRYGKSLFVASGGSGHAFKFLPVLGESILERMEGLKNTETGTTAHRDDLWRWREKSVGELEVNDGSRGGAKSAKWEDEEWGRVQGGTKSTKSTKSTYAMKSRL